MADDSQQATNRRAILKKSTTAAALAVGGVTATGVVTAGSDGEITAVGDGDYTVQVAAEDVDVVSTGVWDSITSTNTSNGTIWTIEGYVEEREDDFPASYAEYAITDYGGYQNKTSDAGVDVDITIY